MVLSESTQHLVAGVQETAQYLWEKGWAERNAGNISVNVTEQVGDAGDLSPQRVCAGDLPCPELPAHLAIHQFLLRTGARQRAFVHTHPTNLIALTLLFPALREDEINRLL